MRRRPGDFEVGDEDHPHALDAERHDAAARDRRVRHEGGAEAVLFEELGQHRGGGLVERAAAGDAHHGPGPAPVLGDALLGMLAHGDGGGADRRPLVGRGRGRTVVTFVGVRLDVVAPAQVLDQGADHLLDLLELHLREHAAGGIVAASRRPPRATSS